MSNKVKFGLKNVHYAVITEGAQYTYATPVPMPGVVSLELEPRGETSEFFADDSTYFRVEANQGYEGTLEIALVPDIFRVEVLGYKRDSNNVLFEDATALAKKFALLFEFSGDVSGIRHVLYDVHAGRPTLASTTKGTTIEVVPESLAITAAPAADTGYVKAKMLPAQAGYATFFAAVYHFAATP